MLRRIPISSFFQATRNIGIITREELLVEILNPELVLIDLREPKLIKVNFRRKTDLLKIRSRDLSSQMLYLGWLYQSK